MSTIENVRLEKKARVRLQLRSSTVDSELGAQDESGLVREQEGDVSGDLIGSTHAADRHLCGKTFHCFVQNLRRNAQLSNNWRCDEARIHDIDVDSSRQQISGERLGQRVETSLGGSVGAGSGNSRVRRTATVQDDGRSFFQHR